MAVRDVDVPALLARLGIKTTRRGRSVWACCPFHEERTPSWRIWNDPSDTKHGTWKCFGSCADGDNYGDVVSLVRRLLGLNDRAEAWRWIKGDAEAVRAPPLRFSIEVEQSAPRRRFELPAGVIVAPVSEWVSPARAYLESRGVPAAQAERWGLGYAVGGFMAGRIVIPARDHSGRLLNCTGRTFVRAAKRYREPNESEGARKDAVFGEAFWPPLGKRRTVVLVEGAFDAMAVERAANMFVAAPFGSEFLPGHAARLATFEEVVVASDPDKAGEKLWKAARDGLARWTRTRRAMLPDGMDASDLAARDEHALAEILTRVQ